MQQGPEGGELPQGIDGYELMVDNFAEQAKLLWRSWGPAGEPMVQGRDYKTGSKLLMSPYANLHTIA